MQATKKTKKIKVSWDPLNGIPGNTLGTLSWESSLSTIVIFAPQVGEFLTLDGNGKVVLNEAGVPDKPVEKSVFKFYEVDENEELIFLTSLTTYVYQPPLIVASWSPLSPWDPFKGVLNYRGILSYQTVGAAEVTINGKKLESTSGKIPYEVRPTNSRNPRFGSFIIKAIDSKRSSRSFRLDWKV